MLTSFISPSTGSRTVTFDGIQKPVSPGHEALEDTPEVLALLTLLFETSNHSDPEELVCVACLYVFLYFMSDKRANGHLDVLLRCRQRSLHKRAVPPASRWNITDVSLKDLIDHLRINHPITLDKVLQQVAAPIKLATSKGHW